MRDRLRAADSYQAFRNTTRFGSLDGLRCLSIIGVIWHHGPGHKMHGLLRHGFLGVDLFFVISGFLITTLLLRERDRFGEISLKNFYARRSLRIFPLYYTILGLYIVLVSLFGDNESADSTFFGNLPYFLTYTSNWFIGKLSVTFGFSWSLAAEEQFYLAWPWVERYLPGRRPVWLALAAIVVVAVLGALAEVSGSTDMEDWLVWRILVSIPAGICLGVLVAHTLHSKPGFEAAWNVLGRRWSSLAAFVLVPVMLAIGAGRFVDLVLALVVCSCVIREDHVLSRTLSSRPLAHVGMVSYGMYLMHGLVYQCIRRAPILRTLHPVAQVPLAIAGTIAGASLSFRYFEKVFLQFKKHFVRVRIS